MRVEGGRPSPQIDDLDPVRHLAHRVVVGDRQRAGLRVVRWTVIAFESSPTASKNRPRGSMLKPRGVFSVGQRPISDSFPVASSIVNPAKVLDLRSLR